MKVYDCILVRYGEIGTKSSYVQHKLIHLLRQRVEDRLEYENLEYDKVATSPGRIKIIGADEKAVEPVSELPGVESASPVLEVSPEIQAMKKAAEKFEYGQTFGVDASRSGEHDFNSRDVARELGSHIEGLTGADVDLDNPDTWLNVDLRQNRAYIFTETIQGPGGLPVGSQDSLAALISGGIDSPVAAFEVMKRGADIIPIYFYNQPIAAEDHWLRVKKVVEKLKRYNPSRNWYIYRIDMGDINEQLLEHGRGRMVAQRVIMFRIAEKIVEKEGLNGIVTGEALGQKSTQTSHNLHITSRQVDVPVHRPLIGSNKESIVKRAKKVGNFETANINSACSTMAPENPATQLSESDLQVILSDFDLEKEIEKAVECAKKVSM